MVQFNLEDACFNLERVPFDFQGVKLAGKSVQLGLKSVHFLERVQFDMQMVYIIWSIIEQNRPKNAYSLLLLTPLNSQIRAFSRR